jgi:hypothetical protein
LDPVGLFCPVLGHGIKGNVKRGTQIVSDVTNDQGKFGRDGFLCFGSQGNLFGLRATMKHELEGALSQKGIHSPAKVVDVMFGPL